MTPFFEGGPHHREAPVRLAPPATCAWRPEAGPVLGIERSIAWRLPAALTLTSGLKECPPPCPSSAPGAIGGREQFVLTVFSSP